MKRTLLSTTVLVLASLAACEGEPPKVASGPAASVAAVPAPEPAPPPPPPTCAPPPPAPCPLVADAGAEDAATDAAEAPAAPLKKEKASIRGTVTTTPAGLTPFAVVYLDDVPKDAAPHPAQVEIDNVKMSFQPFVAVIPAGGKVVFRNTDPFPHNVFSADHEKFDMGSIPHGGARVRAFDSAGAYALLCNMHPGMLGYLLVTPSSAFAKVDAKGHFVLPDVPVGPHKLTAWAPRNQPSSQTVTVSDDVDVTFELHR